MGTSSTEDFLSAHGDTTAEKEGVCENSKDFVAVLSEGCDINGTPC